ncbi:MAG: PLP-dependent aspartate aminotransferase family protein [Candidatus Omnitrophota bacterium]
MCKRNLKDQELAVETFLAQAGSDWDERTGAVSVPVYQTATFGHPELGKSTGFDYSRSSNPTRLVLEETLARLEGGVRGFAFASGLSAIDAVFRIFSPGDSVIVTEDLYGGTHRLFEKVIAPYGIKIIPADTSDIHAVRAVMQPSVKGLFVESLTNPMLRVADFPALGKLAQERGLVFIVDNTFLTPLFLKPFEHGADITVYSATKYLGGHNDVLAGAVVVKDKALAEKIAFLQNAVGAVLGPQDSWLMLRGLKTLSLRLHRQEQNALRIAAWLVKNPLVKAVHYPGLSAHPGHARLSMMAKGFGGIISFEVAEGVAVKDVLSHVRVFIFAESLGGVESLITYPSVQTHADIAPALRLKLGISDRLFRLSIGIEDAGDLIVDLQQALELSR